MCSVSAYLLRAVDQLHPSLGIVGEVPLAPATGQHLGLHHLGVEESGWVKLRYSGIQIKTRAYPPSLAPKLRYFSDPGPKGTLSIPSSTRYLLPTLYHKVPFACHGPRSRLYLLVNNTHQIVGGDILCDFSGLSGGFCQAKLRGGYSGLLQREIVLILFENVRLRV